MQRSALIYFNTNGFDSYTFNNQLKSLQEDFDIYPIDSEVDYEKFKKMVEYVHNHKYNNLTYLTEDEDWPQVEYELKLDFGHLFEDIKTLPILAQRLYEGDIPQQQQTVQQQPVKAPRVNQTARTVAMQPGANVFIISNNLPLKGSKQEIANIILQFKIDNVNNFLVVPSAKKEWFQFLTQGALLFILSDYLKVPNVDNISFLSLNNAKFNQNTFQIRQIKNPQDIVVHCSKVYADQLTPVGAKEVKVDINSAYPNIQENKKVYDLCIKILDEVENQPKDIDVKEKQETAKSIDYMLGFIITQAKDYSEGKWSADQREQDKKALSEKYKHIIDDILGFKHDKAAAEQYVKDSGGALLLDIAKAGKELLKPDKKKQALNQKRDISFTHRMMKCKSYPALKNMFDNIN
jgi:hypothetical protein